MSYDIISYVLIGSIFTAVMVPLIALLRKSIREQKNLDEVKRAKKSSPHEPNEVLSPYTFVD